jgi:hypothetical protein
MWGVGKGWGVPRIHTAQGNPLPQNDGDGMAKKDDDQQSELENGRC